MSHLVSVGSRDTVVSGTEVRCCHNEVQMMIAIIILHTHTQIILIKNKQTNTSYSKKIQKEVDVFIHIISRKRQSEIPGNL